MAKAKVGFRFEGINNLVMCEVDVREDGTLTADALRSPITNDSARGLKNKIKDADGTEYDLPDKTQLTEIVFGEGVGKLDDSIRDMAERQNAFTSVKTISLQENCSVELPSDSFFRFWSLNRESWERFGKKGKVEFDSAKDGVVQNQVQSRIGTSPQVPDNANAVANPQNISNSPEQTTGENNERAASPLTNSDSNTQQKATATNPPGPNAQPKNNNNQPIAPTVANEGSNPLQNQANQQINNQNPPIEQNPENKENDKPLVIDDENLDDDLSETSEQLTPGPNIDTQRNLQKPITNPNVQPEGNPATSITVSQGDDSQAQSQQKTENSSSDSRPGNSHASARGIRSDIYTENLDEDRANKQVVSWLGGVRGLDKGKREEFFKKLAEKGFIVETKDGKTNLGIPKGKSITDLRDAVGNTLVEMNINPNDKKFKEKATLIIDDAGEKIGKKTEELRENLGQIEQIGVGTKAVARVEELRGKGTSVDTYKNQMLQQYAKDIKFASKNSEEEQRSEIAENADRDLFREGIKEGVAHQNVKNPNFLKNLKELNKHKKQLEIEGSIFENSSDKKDISTYKEIKKRLENVDKAIEKWKARNAKNDEEKTQ